MKATEYMNSNKFLKKNNWTTLANCYEEDTKLIEKDDVTFSVYNLRINLCTYFKGSIYKRLRVVGVPLSISESGYEAISSNGFNQLASWVKSQKGFTIIINANKDFDNYFKRIDTLPTMLMKVDFKTYDEYKDKLRSHYRYRLKKAENLFRGITYKENLDLNNDSNLDKLYKLYENVYEASEYKLDKCTKEYFRSFNAECTGFYEENNLIGFCQYKEMDGVLYFLFCGMDYNYLKKYDTYYNMLLYLIEKATELGVNSINFGQTTEITKCRLGANIDRRYIYIYHSNRLIRKLLYFVAPSFSYRVPEIKYNIFK